MLARTLVTCPSEAAQHHSRSQFKRKSESHLQLKRECSDPPPLSASDLWEEVGALSTRLLPPHCPWLLVEVIVKISGDRMLQNSL